jgi:hypothetical protein
MISSGAGARCDGDGARSTRAACTTRQSGVETGDIGESPRGMDRSAARPTIAGAVVGLAAGGGRRGTGFLPHP